MDYNINSYMIQLEWRTAMKEDPAVRGSFLDVETHAKYIRSRIAGTPQYDLIVNS